VPRSSAQITSDAEHLRDEAIALEAAASARLLQATQKIATAQQAAQSARTATDQAKAAAAASNIREAEAKSKDAVEQLAVARGEAGQAFPGLGGGDPKDEWKECRASIDRFDKLLVDFRKTGFGFVTALVGAAALLLGTVNAPTPAHFKFWAFVVLEVLIIALFIVDCSHQIFLSAAVKRAQELEADLNYKITRAISKKFGAFEAILLGVAVYLIMYAAAAVIFWEALEKDAGQWHAWMSYSFYASIGVGVAFVFGTFLRSIK
jgi:hypothetical protein